MNKDHFYSRYARNRLGGFMPGMGGTCIRGFHYRGQPLAANALNLAIHAAWQRSKELTSELPSASTTALTLREVECLAWVAKGKTDIEIARIIDVAPRTVRFHVHNAKVKLNVATRIQAVTKLMRERPDLRDPKNEN